jgi:hypothetical protein
MACALIAGRKTRRYGLYICETQDQADDHVGNVATMLESDAFAARYPEAAERAIGKYGRSKGWRRNRIRTASGFTLDAIGLDTAARGAKLDEDRPDLLVFDDLDNEHDTADAIDKKLASITRKLIPAGASDVAILGLQNLVHADGIFARLADGRADFLHNRIVSGPHPAIRDLVYATDRDGRHRLLGGSPTWAGQDLARCQAMVDDMGLRAFLSECQHDVQAPEGLVLGHDFDGIRIYDPARNVREAPTPWGGCKWRVVGIDPGGRDPTAMIALGVDASDRHHVYAVHSRPGPMDPVAIHEWLSALHARGPLDAIVIDTADTAAQLGTILSTLTRMGWPTWPANRGNALGIPHLRMLLKSGRLTIPPRFRDAFESEIKAWQFPVRRETETGASGAWTTIVRSTTHHADRLKALQYACVAVLDAYPPGRGGGEVRVASASRVAAVVSAGR